MNVLFFIHYITCEKRDMNVFVVIQEENFNAFQEHNFFQMFVVVFSFQRSYLLQRKSIWMYLNKKLKKIIEYIIQAWNLRLFKSESGYALDFGEKFDALTTKFPHLTHKPKHILVVFNIPKIPFIHI